MRIRYGSASWAQIGTNYLLSVKNKQKKVASKTVSTQNKKKTNKQTNKKQSETKQKQPQYEITQVKLENKVCFSQKNSALLGIITYISSAIRGRSRNF